LPLVIGYTGIKADTPSLVRKVAELRKEQTDFVDNIFNLISKIVEEARGIIEKGNLVKLGQLMNLNQGLLNSLGVSSFELEKLIIAARKSGSYGAKLSGAGGGDCLVALVGKAKKSEVEKVIKKKGGKVLHVKTGAEGVRVE